MDRLPIYVFKNSFGSILKLLNENNVQYQMRETRSGVAYASSGVVEVLTSAAMWGALATIAVAFIRSKSGRKVTITTRDEKIIHAEGLTAKELESILKQAKNIAAIDTEND